MKIKKNDAKRTFNLYHGLSPFGISPNTLSNPGKLSNHPPNCQNKTGKISARKLKITAENLRRKVSENGRKLAFTRAFPPSGFHPREKNRSNVPSPDGKTCQ